MAAMRKAEQSGTVNIRSVSAGKRFSAGGMAAEIEKTASQESANAARESFGFIEELNSAGGEKLRGAAGLFLRRLFHGHGRRRKIAVGIIGVVG